jgi:hypothetical protein
VVPWGYLVCILIHFFLCIFFTFNSSLASGISISLCHIYFLVSCLRAYSLLTCGAWFDFICFHQANFTFLVDQVWAVCWTAPILYKLSLCTYTTHSQGYHAYFRYITCCHFFSKYQNWLSSWISQDPVKYPDNMSANFKSFLKGLLNKVINGIYPRGQLLN